MNEINLAAATTAPTASPAVQLAVIEFRIRDHMNKVAENFLAVGQCLNDAKAADLVPHGEWEAWVAKNTGFTARQAQRLMQAAREVPEGSAMAQLPMTKIQACLQLPSPEDRESMAQRVQNEGLTLRQLQEEVKRANDRADRAEKKRLEVEGNLRSHDAQAANERKQLRQQLADAEARAQTAASGISAEARAEIDRLKGELEDAEGMIARQAELRQQAQQELLNYQAQAARGEVQEPDTSLTPMELAVAVRTFVGTVGVLPHMGLTLARAADADRQEMQAYVDMMAEWVEGARRALNTMYIDGND